MKTTSRIAILAAAGLFATSAQAADLGGNCCTDLEERVAELEATTARKGNRKVSLTVYGQVNQAVIFWDDGFEKNQYVAMNDDSRTRFGFKGRAKINSDWTAGYRLEFGVRDTRIDRQSQNSHEGGEDSVDFRQSNWYLQSKTFGRVTVGLATVVSSGINTLNLANIQAPYLDEIGEGFNIYNRVTGAYEGNSRRYRNYSINGEGSYSFPSTPRAQIVRYDTPTFAGFTLSANWGNDDRWDIALRYANEFNGVRIAAAASYTEFSGWTGTAEGRDRGCVAGPSGSSSAVDCYGWIIGASMMHIPTGLFIAGSYQSFTDDFRAAGVEENDYQWNISGGIERKWNALGKTTLYVAYREAVADGAFGYGSGNPGSAEGTHLTFGMTQRIDAAAMDLYLAYYIVDAEETAAGATVVDGEFEAVVMGAKIKF